MVNYLYDLDQIEKNHEAFADEGRFTAARRRAQAAADARAGAPARRAAT